MHASHICDLHNSQKGRPMIRCCGRISCFRILHLLSPKAGNCNEKAAWASGALRFFSDNTRTASGCLFCDKFTVGSSHKVTAVTQSERDVRFGPTADTGFNETYRCGELSRRESTVVASCKVSCVCLCCANRMAPIDRPPKNTATNAKPHAVPRHGELGLTPHSCLSKSSQSR